MPKTKISEFSATPANNTDIDSINIAEGCAPSGINDAIRELMAQLKDFQTGAQGDSFNGPINGAINGTVGATTPNTGAFTTLTTTGSAGIASTISSWGSTWKAVQMNYGGSVFANSGVADIALSSNSYWNGASLSSNAVYIRSEAAAYYRIAEGAHAWYRAASGTAGNAITFTQAMTLDASGRLLVGTTSSIGTASVGRLQVLGGETFITTNSEVGGFVGVNSNSDNSVAIVADPDSLRSGSHIAFYVDGFSEKARIDSSGNLLVGQTAKVAGEKFSVYTGTLSTNTAYLWYGQTDDRSGVIFRHDRATGATSAKQCSFLNQTASEVGYISSTGSATAYNTSSDYRLKNTITPMTGALAKVAQLKPVTYKWNADGSNGEGFIAHELAEVVPQCVTGAKDAVDEDGNPQYQGIDTSFLVATLTAALQEAVAEINSLKARLDAANL